LARAESTVGVCPLRPRWAAGTGAVRRLLDTDITIETMDRREIGETETTGNEENRTGNWTATRGNDNGLRIGVATKDIREMRVEAVDMKADMIEERIDITLRK
jgi:hypothetical protein